MRNSRKRAGDQRRPGALIRKLQNLKKKERRKKKEKGS